MTYVMLDRKESGVRPINPLVYLDEDSNRWGWWCPPCTTGDETPFGQKGYRSKTDARKSAVKHEDRTHNHG